MIAYKTLTWLWQSTKSGGWAALAWMLLCIFHQAFLTHTGVQWSLGRMETSTEGLNLHTPLFLALISMVISAVMLPPLSFFYHSAMHRFSHFEFTKAINQVPLADMSGNQYPGIISRLRKYALSAPASIFSSTTTLLAHLASLIMLTSLFKLLPWWIPLSWIIIPLGESLIRSFWSKRYHGFIQENTGLLQKSELIMQWISLPNGLADLRSSGHTSAMVSERHRLLKSFDLMRFRFNRRMTVFTGLMRLLLLAPIVPGFLALYRLSCESDALMTGILVLALRTWQGFRGISGALVQIISDWPFLRELISFCQRHSFPVLSLSKHSNRAFHGKISLKEVSFSYDPKKQLIRGLSLAVVKGDIIIIHGEAGSGKSTLARILAGQILPQGGEIEINGKTGLMAQDFPRLDDILLTQIMASGKQLRTDELEDCLNWSGFKKIMEDRKLNFHSKVGMVLPDHLRMNQGAWQSLALARTLYHNQILILDEPDAFLDDEGKNSLKISLKEMSLKKTVIVFTHSTLYDNIATKVYRLSSGKLVSMGVRAGIRTTAKLTAV